MKSLIITVLLCSLLIVFWNGETETKSETQFRDFINEYRIGYGSTQEYEYRRTIFEENMKKAEKLASENPLASFGVTVFSDQTDEEMLGKMGMMNIQIDAEETPFENSLTAKSINWEYLYKGQIKNQGNCGSCWAFSVTSAFEGRYALAKGKQSIDTFYSEQQLVDCCSQSSGCNGGYLDSTFQYLTSTPFCTGSQYPYKGVKGACNQGICRGGPTATGRYIYPYKNENAVLEGLMKGPISVCLDATQWSSYRSGIMTSCGTQMTHCVTVVGSNFEHSTPYVRLRNSWGGSWGEKGHINLKIGQNLCRYADYGEIPLF